jgi:hypothetical protein
MAFVNAIHELNCEGQSLKCDNYARNRVNGLFDRFNLFYEVLSFSAISVADFNLTQRTSVNPLIAYILKFFIHFSNFLSVSISLRLSHLQQ